MSDLFGFYKSDDELNNEKIKRINGLSIYNDFINTQEENYLIEKIESSSWIDDLKRKVQHYGYKYNYKTRKIDESLHIGDLPIWMSSVLNKIQNLDSQIDQIDQVIVNNYEVGQGISPHIDCEPCFGNYIISLSLMSDIVMQFRHQDNGDLIEVKLPRRSLIIIKDDARYKFTHGIAPRKKDLFNDKYQNRSRRISMTFRNVLLNNSF